MGESEKNLSCVCEIEREREREKRKKFTRKRDSQEEGILRRKRDGGAKAQDVHPALRHIRRQRLQRLLGGGEEGGQEGGIVV